MDNETLYAWVAEIDALYTEVFRCSDELMPLARQLLRDYVWPYYHMAD